MLRYTTDTGPAFKLMFVYYTSLRKYVYEIIDNIDTYIDRQRIIAYDIVSGISTLPKMKKNLMDINNELETYKTPINKKGDILFYHFEQLISKCNDVTERDKDCSGKLIDEPRKLFETNLLIKNELNKRIIENIDYKHKFNQKINY